MRIRRVAVLALVLPALIPSESSAQRFPRIWGRGPAQPAPLPPQAPGIARQLAYRRLPVSVESYPLITYVASPGVAGNAIAPSKTSFGVGTRIDYRMARVASATLDVTSTLVGGSNTQTVELGTRLRPERNERRYYPFVDLRVGYAQAYDEYFRPFDVIDQSANSPGYGTRYSHGLGLIGGGGLEIAMSRTLSLTTAVTAMRARMTTVSIYGPSDVNAPYSMTTYRGTLGLRWNPVRFITPN